MKNSILDISEVGVQLPVSVTLGVYVRHYVQVETRLHSLPFQVAEEH